MVTRFLSLLLYCLFFTGSIFAQRIAESELPLSPPTGLLDDDGVLKSNNGAQRRLIKLIQTLERDHGFRIFVVLSRSLIGSTPSDLSSKLQTAWVPEGDGLVIVFESDTRKLGFGRDLEGSEGLSSQRTSVPAYGLVEIISKALKESDGETQSEIYIETLVSHIAMNLDSYFKRKTAPADGGRSLRLALVAIGALSLLALAGMGLGWLMGKSDQKQMEVRFFPPVNQPERLGAPYGGGGGTLCFLELEKETDSHLSS